MKTVNINADKTIGTPNPRMWGIFYEEINHAGDGGIYAELLRNRNFSETDVPAQTVYAAGKIQTAEGHVEQFDLSDPLPGWSVRRAPGASALIEKTADDPRNPACPSQMKLLFDGSVRIVNGGYWGVAAKRGGYSGTLIVKSGDVSMLTVGFMRKDGSVIASAAVAGICAAYQKIGFTLTVTAEDRNARFFIEAAGKGSVYFDFVSLFPDSTYQNRKNGFRPDLVETLKAMKPGFMRFPGGCVVEGINLKNAIHWKDTVGPIEDRPGHWDLWHYRCTDGLGMLEFCQLAEDIGAELMYVCNCGMSCQFRHSEAAENAALDQWLSDTLDAVEYICGDTATYWGAKRAEHGHPAPFALKYLEIGNENRDDVYHAHYKKFFAALRERYPSLILIANERVPGADYDLVDDHYYTPPQTFPQLTGKYNGDGEEVYVGEYACNTDVGYGNLLSAISEATFMTHMENRCDRVRIASYAPLFCNDHDRTWPVNLINFDNNNVFGLPSYYVQRMFANNTVERVVATDCTDTAAQLCVTAGIAGKELVIKAANFGADAVQTVFQCAKIKAGAVSVGTLSGECETDTNSLLYPENVTEVTASAASDDGRINITLPAWSFTVLRAVIN